MHPCGCGGRGGRDAEGGVPYGFVYRGPVVVREWPVVGRREGKTIPAEKINPWNLPCQWKVPPAQHPRYRAVNFRAHQSIERI